MSNSKLVQRGLQSNKHLQMRKLLLLRSPAEALVVAADAIDPWSPADALVVAADVAFSAISDLDWR